MRAKTVLLVEDDLTIRDVLQDQLEGEGYDVVPATNGKQAIDYVTLDARPDLIILDLMTPIVTGWEVLSRLRRDPELARIPVIVVTATSGEPPPGATAFLRKPFGLTALFEAVRAIV
jgi:CheY-like chemotaxis protein